MNKDRLKEIIIDQKDIFSKRSNLIDRDVSLDPYIKTSRVVVITGVRRCGKSSLLFLIKQRMQLRDMDYCYFNFDDERIIGDIEVFEEIDNIHRELYDKDAILFFDEIQNIKGWEKFVNRMYEQGRKIFVTGSNASILSSEISSSLTGRNKTLELLPFSFKEYLRLKKVSVNKNRLGTKEKTMLIRNFNSFFKEGGFPMVIREGDTEILNSYFKDIVYRDIVARYRLSQVEEMKHIALYFFANSAKIFSYATLQKISGIKSLSSIKNYLHYYSQAYLFFYLPKFDYSLKKQMLTSKKVFAIDQGFIHRIGFNFSENKGRIIENIVFLELVRRKKKVFYYNKKGECDFVVKENLHITEAIQVTYELNAENIKREIFGLQEALNEFKLNKGVIIVMNIDTDINEIPSEIEVIKVWKWLLL